MTRLEILGRLEERLRECELLVKHDKDKEAKALHEGQRQGLLECKGWLLRWKEA